MWRRQGMGEAQPAAQQLENGKEQCAANHVAAACTPSLSRCPPANKTPLHTCCTLVTALDTALLLYRRCPRKPSPAKAARATTPPSPIFHACPMSGSAAAGGGAGAATAARCCRAPELAPAAAAVLLDATATSLSCCCSSCAGAACCTTA